MIDLEFDVLDEDAKQSICSSAAKLLADLRQENDTGKTLRKQIWPTIATTADDEISLKLVPLNRLGANEGKSSASVFVAYFRPNGSKWPSHPLVVKFAKPTEEGDSCQKEFEDYQSVANLVDLSPCGFAAPLVCHRAKENQPFTVLWSPFASAGGVWGPDAYEQKLVLEAKDVWNRLTSEATLGHEIKDALDKVYSYLWPLHHRGGQVQISKRKYSAEYGWYLRSINQALWAERWKQSWGNDESELTNDFSSEWHNPFSVLKRISDLEVNMLCGSVHGDLHPKNIVLTLDGPKIIDFGWARDDAHIAKDFVLMECNIRFVTLPSFYNFSDVLKLSEWLEFGKNPPDFDTEDLQKRAQLIQHVRERAKKAFRKEATDWNKEYIIPMFLVALGLLKHSDDFFSHISTRLHVLQLAKYIIEKELAKDA